MSQRRHQQADALLQQERYQPEYVEAFLQHRQYPDQSIEEWTAAEGSMHYGANQIYKPLSISVSISGPSDNLFSVDCSKVDWHPRLVSAVTSSLIAARRATDGDTVTLSDVRGVPISADMSGAAMRNAGVIYPVVNGKRLTRSPLIGQEMQVQTPVSHQSNKEAILANWSQGVAQKAIALVAATANGASDATGVDQRLFGSTSCQQQVKQLVEKEIASVGEMFMDESASADEISSAISDAVMGAVEQAYQKRSSDLVAFFKHQQAVSQRSPSLSSSQSSQQQQVGRSIFSAGAKSEKERAEQQLVQGSISRAIEIRYPTQLSLHKDILAPLATSDQTLYTAIGHCLCAPSRRYRGGGREGGGGRRRRRPEVSVTTTTTTTDNSSVPSATAAATTSQKIGAPVDHLASFRALLGEEQYIRAIASKNALAGVPPSPGFVLVESHCGTASQKKKEKNIRRNRVPMLMEQEFSDPREGRASLVDRIGSLQQPERRMPALDTTTTTTATGAAAAAVKPSERRMPGLEAVAVASAVTTQPISRPMPALDSAPLTTADKPQRKMPGLETVPVAVATVTPAAAPIAIKSAMPGLETFGPSSTQRIKHTAKQLPQINN